MPGKTPRSPAGRRAPAKKAPARPRRKPADAAAPGAPPKAAAAGSSVRRLRIKQVRSGIGHAATYRRTLRALGLRHYQDVIVVKDTPSTRGMLHKVRHLVAVLGEEA
jgi:large subunit ribosomal protein L30